MLRYEVEFLIELLKVYSPTGQEGDLARLLASKMRDLGFNVHIDSVGNVIGEIGSSGPNVLLCGHMDTVPGFIPVKVEGNEIWGRGAVDAKGPLATLVLAAKRYSSQHDELKLTVIGVVEEEGSSKGMYHVLETTEEPEIAIFGEPSGVSCLALGYKGSITFKLTVKSEEGHSASPWLFKNSIEEAWALWSLLKREFSSYINEKSRFHSLTYCLTSINGGGSSVFTPSQCTMKFNVRLPLRVKCHDIIELVKKTAMDYASKRGVEVEVEWSDCVEAYAIGRSSIIARAFSRAIIEELRVKPSFTYKTGTSDINVAATKWKQAEMAAYGPGDASLDHTPWERINIDEYLKAINVLTRTLWWIAKLKK